jgi:hypothetical protein
MELGGGGHHHHHPNTNTTTTNTKSRILHPPNRTHSHASALRFFRGTYKSIFQEESFCQPPPNRRMELRIVKTSSFSDATSSSSPSSRPFGWKDSTSGAPPPPPLPAGSTVTCRQKAERQFHRKRLHRLKRALHKELLQDATERHQKKQLQAISRIQAVVRGYTIRAHLLRFHPRRPQDFFRRHHHHHHHHHHHRRSGTTMSEITMSDFGDSFASLGSLSLSPSGLHDFGLLEDDREDENEHLWESLSIEREEEEKQHLQLQLQPPHPHQDSFASLFSEASSGDVAAKLPARKHSPKKTTTTTNDEDDDGIISPTRVSQTPPRIPLPSPTTPRILDLPTIEDDGCVTRRRPSSSSSSPPTTTTTTTSSSPFVLQPRPRQYLRSMTTVVSQERGHSSLSSFFVRDVPIQIPQRSRSPIPDGVASVPVIPTKQPSPPRARGYTR